MSENKIQELVATMDPLDAAAQMAAAAKSLFSLLGEDYLRRFLSQLIGEKEQDKVSGLVHL